MDKLRANSTHYPVSSSSITTPTTGFTIPVQQQHQYAHRQTSGHPVQSNNNGPAVLQQQQQQPLFSRAEQYADRIVALLESVVFVAIITKDRFEKDAFFCIEFHLAKKLNRMMYFVCVDNAVIPKHAIHDVQYYTVKEVSSTENPFPTKEEIEHFVNNAPPEIHPEEQEEKPTETLSKPANKKTPHTVQDEDDNVPLDDEDIDTQDMDDAIPIQSFLNETRSSKSNQKKPVASNPQQRPNNQDSSPTLRKVNKVSSNSHHAKHK